MFSCVCFLLGSALYTCFSPGSSVILITAAFWRLHPVRDLSRQHLARLRVLFPAHLQGGESLKELRIFPGSSREPSFLWCRQYAVPWTSMSPTSLYLFQILLSGWAVMSFVVLEGDSGPNALENGYLSPLLPLLNTCPSSTIRTT